MSANTVHENHSYNRYLAVASRALRRSLKEDKRIIAERRGEAAEIKFAKWSVSNNHLSLGYRGIFRQEERKEDGGNVTSEEIWKQTTKMNGHRYWRQHETEANHTPTFLQTTERQA